MNKDKLFSYVRLLWAPVALIVLGAVLLFNPDSASALISKVLGGLLTLIGIAFGISAIAEEKGEVPEVELECVVDIRMSAHIPEKYISALSQRLAAYRRIAAIRTKEDVLDVTDELLDRYGDLPKVVSDLIDVSYLKNKAAMLGITEISEQNGRLLLYCNGLNESIGKLVSSSIKNRVVFRAGAKPYVAIKPAEKQPMLSTLKEALTFMGAEI